MGGRDAGRYSGRSGTNDIPKYHGTGETLLRINSELKDKTELAKELKVDMRSLKERDDTTKAAFWDLKRKIRVNDIAIQKLERDHKNTLKQLKIEAEFEVNKTHDYTFDFSPGQKKLTRWLGYLEIGLVSGVALMESFPQQAGQMFGFPTDAQVLDSLMVGTALNTVAYLFSKILQKVYESREDSAKSKIQRIIDQFSK